MTAEVPSTLNEKSYPYDIITAMKMPTPTDHKKDSEHGWPQRPRSVSSSASRKAVT